MAVSALEENARHGTVAQWSGREVQALRAARRMSVRDFASHLGVSDRMVSKWESGGLSIRPRPVNQAALDTSLGQASPDIQSRFAAILEGRAQRAVRQRMSEGEGCGVHLVRHPEDGKLMTLVEEGPCRLGLQGRDRWLTGFYIDVFPTSNADYAQFLNATGHAAPRHWPDGEPPADRLHHPVTGVSWHDATSYTEWAAKALPSGQEWEKAARGPLGCPYPWGEHAGTSRANVREARIGTTTPVNRYDNGVSPYGVYDLCGNVAEWCRTSRGPGVREARGGGYAAPLHQARPAASAQLPEAEHGPDLGFRCVLTVEAMLALLFI